MMGSLRRVPRAGDRIVWGLCCLALAALAGAGDYRRLGMGLTLAGLWWLLDGHLLLRKAREDHR